MKRFNLSAAIALALLAASLFARIKPHYGTYGFHDGW